MLKDNRWLIVPVFWLILLITIFLLVPSRGFAEVLGSWDAGWYRSIIRDGYAMMISSLEQSNVAFFPLFPLLGNILSSITPLSPLAALTALSWAGLAGGIIMFRKLTTRTELLALVLAQPVAFFFLMPYTESIFLFLSLAAYYFMKQERWLAASLIIGVASGTRITGILLVILLLGYLRQAGVLKLNNFKQLAVYGSASVLGLASYMLFLYNHTGDALAFRTVQKAWGRSGNIGDLFDEVRFSVEQTLAFDMGINLNLSILVFAVVFGLSTYMYKKDRNPEAAFLLVNAILPIASGSFTSFSRYSIVLVPFIVLYFASHLSKKRAYQIAAVLLVMQIITFAYFIQDYQPFVA
jgi:Gpi18-like mannosyltransferase